MSDNGCDDCSKQCHEHSKQLKSVDVLENDVVELKSNIGAIAETVANFAAMRAKVNIIISMAAVLVTIILSYVTFIYMANQKFVGQYHDDRYETLQQITAMKSELSEYNTKQEFRFQQIESEIKRMLDKQQLLMDEHRRMINSNGGQSWVAP